MLEKELHRSQVRIHAVAACLSNFCCDESTSPWPVLLPLVQAGEAGIVRMGARWSSRVGFPCTGCWRCSLNSTSTAVPGRSPARRHPSSAARPCTRTPVRVTNGTRRCCCSSRETCSGFEAGSYSRLIDFCITQLKAQGPRPSRAPDESACTLPRTACAPPEQTACLAPPDLCLHLPNQKDVVHPMGFGRSVAPVWARPRDLALSGETYFSLV